MANTNPADLNHGRFYRPGVDPQPQVDDFPIGQILDALDAPRWLLAGATTGEWDPDKQLDNNRKALNLPQSNNVWIQGAEDLGLSTLTSPDIALGGVKGIVKGLMKGARGSKAAATEVIPKMGKAIGSEAKQKALTSPTQRAFRKAQGEAKQADPSRRAKAHKAALHRDNRKSAKQELNDMKAGAAKQDTDKEGKLKNVKKGTPGKTKLYTGRYKRGKYSN